MSEIIALLLVFLLPQIWAGLRGKTAAVRIISLVCSLGVATVWQGWMLTQEVRRSSLAADAPSDTFYVVAHFQFITGSSGALILLAILLTLAETPQHPLPAAADWLASLFAVCVTCNILLPFAVSTLWSKPQRYVDYPEWIGTFALIANILSWGVIALGSALFLLAVTFLLRRVWHAPKTR